MGMIAVLVRMPLRFLILYVFYVHGVRIIAILKTWD